MRQKQRSSLRAAWVLGVLVTVLVLPPLLLGAMPGRWCECEFRAALRHAKDLDARRREAQRVSEAKREVLQQLLAGRFTLRAAAERFRTLSAESPHFPLKAVREMFPAACEEETWCRSVLACAAMEVRDQPRGRDDALGRLRAEFAELSGQWSHE